MFKTFLRWWSSWSVLSALALMAALLYLVWVSACALGTIGQAWDDNFMTYIYGRNLSQGHGFRYNASDPEPTEGFSSLSHVVYVALASRLHVDALLASRALSLACFLLIPAIIGFPLSRILKVPTVAVLAVSYAAQILHFLSVASYFHLQAGMETVIFMGGIACLAGWTLGELDPGTLTSRSSMRRVFVGCFALGFVIVSRPEGPPLALMTLGLLFLARQHVLPELKGLNDRVFLLICGSTILGILMYFFWKKMYFGFFLPNPYYVKAHNGIFGTRGILLPGWDETLSFAVMTMPWVAAGAALYAFARGSSIAKRALLVAALPGLIMVLAYAKAIHEAAVYHRYEFPYLVYLSLLLAGLFSLLAVRMRILPALLVVVVIGWVHYFSNHWENTTPGPADWLSYNLDRMTNAWTDSGRDLARTGLGQQATIALSAAGAIPFYSGFKAIDLVGLNNNFLSGREPHSLEEVWEYIDSFKPDVFQSGLPPASPGIGVDQYDPVFSWFSAFTAARGIPGSEFEKFWDQQKMQRMMRLEMAYLRDHYTFGSAYRIGNYENWILLYVRKDSPFRERIIQTLQSSFRIDRESNLQRVFGTDLRKR